jgi:probable rRNA maturation factor
VVNAPAAAYRVSVIAEDLQRRRLSQRWVRELAKSVLAAESVSPHSRIEVLLAGDDTVRRLNADHRSEDTVTDVLSFPAVDNQDVDDFPAAPGGWIDVGQIALSVPQAERQARELGHPLQAEAAHLIVHGVLHLLGYDHEDSSDQAVMRSHEEALLNSIEGIAVREMHGAFHDHSVIGTVGGGVTPGHARK